MPVISLGRGSVHIYSYITLISSLGGDSGASHYGGKNGEVDNFFHGYLLELVVVCQLLRLIDYLIVNRLSKKRIKSGFATTKPDQAEYT
jgi:hypothetical protein